MSTSRCIPSPVRYVALALAATAASAGGAWFLARGPVLRGLPAGYETHSYQGAPLFLHEGVWYRPWRGGFRACDPPVGLDLPSVPAGSERLWHDGSLLYTFAGVYYREAPGGGYQVTEPLART